MATETDEIRSYISKVGRLSIRSLARSLNNKMPFLFIVTLYIIIIIIVIVCVVVVFGKKKKQLIKRSAHECYLYSRRPKTVGTSRLSTTTTTTVHKRRRLTTCVAIEEDRGQQVRRRSE